MTMPNRKTPRAQSQLGGYIPKWVQELSAKIRDMARALSCRPWLGQAKWCSGRRKPNWHVVSLPPWVGGPSLGSCS